MSEHEVWRPIPGHEGKHEVSNFGRIRSCNRVVIRSNGTVYTVHGRILNPAVDKDGYMQIALKGSGKKHTAVKVHRAVALAFIPNEFGKSEVNHINGNRSDNRIENLEWCTRSENLLHSYRVLRGVVQRRTG